jgi:hypothetical protein
LNPTLFPGGEYLPERALDTMRNMDRNVGFGYGIADVYAHTIRDHHAAAIEALRTAIDQGWRKSWWRLRDLVFSDLADNPEWQALISELEVEVALQRELYETHKDEALWPEADLASD